MRTSTQIAATDPAGTGTVDVTVVNPIGTSATSPADQFTYIDPATTVVNSGSELDVRADGNRYGHSNAGSGTFDNGDSPCGGWNELGSPQPLSGGQATIQDASLAVATTISSRITAETLVSPRRYLLALQFVNQAGSGAGNIVLEPVGVRTTGNLYGHGDARLGNLRQRRHAAVCRGWNELRFAAAVERWPSREIQDAALAGAST